MAEPNAEHQRIATQYQRAVRYATSDPKVALSEARQTAEAICTFLYNAYGEANPSANEFKKPAEKQMLNGMTSSLERVSRYPRMVATAMRTIQAYGNMGAHYQGEETEHVTIESIQFSATIQRQQHRT